MTAADETDAAPPPWGRHAALGGAFTLLSRITGFARDGVIAFFLGTTPLADAYYFAFRVPNLFRRLLGEGAVSAAFIPVFTEHQQAGDLPRRDAFVRVAAGLLLAALLAVALAGAFGARLFAGGSGALSALFLPVGADGPDPALVARLIRWFFPYLVFAGLAALAQGCLNALGVFAVPAASPVVLNLSIILCAIAAHAAGRPVLHGLIAGVLAGGAGQLLIQLPALRGRGIPLRPAWDPAHPGVRLLITRWLPGVWGASVYQLMVFFSARFAAGAAPGTVSALYYAGRLSEVAYGVIILSSASALLPAMARQVHAGDLPGARESLRQGLRWLWFLTAPCAALLACFAAPVTALLLQRGRFDADSVAATAAPTAVCAGAILLQAALRLFLAGCHAAGDTRSPALAATLSLGVFFLAGRLLAPHWGGAGIALAMAIGSACNAGLLAAVCRRRFGGFGGLRRLAWPLALTLACAVAAALAARALHDRAGGALPGRTAVILFAAAGGALYLALARAAGVAEAGLFLAGARDRARALAGLARGRRRG